VPLPGSTQVDQPGIGAGELEIEHAPPVSPNGAASRAAAEMWAQIAFAPNQN
jgi:hypothetical protein